MPPNGKDDYSLMLKQSENDKRIDKKEYSVEQPSIMCEGIHKQVLF